MSLSNEQITYISEFLTFLNGIDAAEQPDNRKGSGLFPDTIVLYDEYEGHEVGCIRRSSDESNVHVFAQFEES